MKKIVAMLLSVLLLWTSVPAVSATHYNDGEMGWGGVVPPPSCNHVFDNICDIECNLCGETREEIPHTYDDNCDVDCNECGEGRQPLHGNIEHVSAKEATCTENGNIEYWYCADCGQAWLDANCTLNTNLKAVILPANDHDWNDADCTNPKICRVCGATEGVALGHTAGAPADCENAQVCTVCGIQLMPALGHSWVEASCLEPKHCSVCGKTEGNVAHDAITHVLAKEATCTENGNIEYWYCADCGQAWLDENCTLNTNLKAVILPANDHDWNDADCTNPKICRICGATEGVALGHTAGAPADCENAQVCTVCGIQLMPALEHSWVEASCLEPKHCSVCGKTEGNVAHDAITHVSAKEATCTENGNIEYWYCADCGQAWLDEACTLNTNLKAVILPANDHDWNDADCTNPKICRICGATEGVALGHTAGAPADCENAQYCAVCGIQLMPALEHSWVEASCLEPKHCSVCGKTEGNVAHDAITHVSAKEATCTENGNIEYWYCADCGQAWLDEACTLNTNLKAVILPANDHDWNDADCTNPKICRICGATEGVALGHTAGAPADCENAQYCAVCGIQLMPALEHSWVEASCLEPKHCSVCGKTEGNVAHDAITHVLAKEATCTENGNIEYWYCADCGQAWLDENCTLNTNLKAVILPVKDHDWNDADCTNPKICRVCGATEGVALGHTAGAPADCEKAQVCTVCGVQMMPALGHSWVEASCLEPKHCSVCGKTEGSVAHDAITHVSAKAPSCTENGNIEYWYCADCGQAWLDENCTLNTNLMVVILPANDHDWNDADCTNPKICRICGATEGVALGHTAGAPADCEKAQVCTVCGIQLMPALGHSWVEASCLEPKHCSVCGKTEGNVAHDAITHVLAKEATCTENGNIEYWYCADCGQAWLDENCTLNTNLMVVILPVNDHDYECVVTEAASCTIPGRKVCTCTHCGYKKIETIPAPGHDYDAAVTAPDCENDGYTIYTCSVCEHKYMDNRVDALGHEYIVTKEVAPSCTEKGMKAYLCNRCGNDYEEVVAAKGHSAVIMKGYAATCEADGLTSGIKCGECDYVHTPQKVIPALGHDYQVTEDIAPTCVADGMKVHTCETCGDNYQEIVVATGEHTYDNEQDTDCNVCGAIREEEKASGDVNGDGKVNLRDVGLLQQYLAGWSVQIHESAADTNGDGAINLRDVGLLQQYLAGWNVKLK